MNTALQEAIQLHKAGRSADALPLYATVLGDEPDNLAALFYGGVAAWRAGQHDLALARLDRVIDRATQPVADAYFHRALVRVSLNRIDEAVADYERSIALKPGYAPAHNNLGLLLGDRGDLTAAAAHLDAALKADPSFHDARYNRGLIAVQMGELPRARSTLAECVKRDADHVAARASLIDVLIDSAEQAEALALARASVKRLPRSPLLWNALAQAEAAAGSYAAAAAAYASGLRIAPNDALLSLNAATLESEQGNFAAARDLYTSLAVTQGNDGGRFRLATLLPVIPQSETQIDEMRQAFSVQLAHLRESGASLIDPLNEFGDTPFYLSYHGRQDDRQLLGELEQTLRAACPTLNFTASHVGRTRRAGKPRVGVCSHFLFDQSVGRAIHAYVKALAADAFALTLLHVPPFFDDHLSRGLSQYATVVRLPFDLAAARATVAALELDLLIFPEIGMDALTYYLALSRLAPAQWTTLGHPCSSGLSTIDSFLSYATLEVPGSERFYSEHLIRLPEGAIYPDYPAPELPGRPHTRRQLGLPGDGPLLICPQSLFKLMPQFDDALHGILQACPTAHILLPQAKHAGQVTAISQRFEKKMGALAKRFIYFPRRSRSEFIALVAACDVMLDPFPVGGGITTWDALVTGIPIVTWPGELMRSRLAWSALAHMDVATTVAHDLESYIAITLRLLADAEERTAVRRAMSAQAESVFRDVRAVPHFVAAVEQAIVV